MMFIGEHFLTFMSIVFMSGCLKLRGGYASGTFSHMFPNFSTSQFVSPGDTLLIVCLDEDMKTSLSPQHSQGGKLEAILGQTRTMYETYWPNPIGVWR